MMRTMLLCPKPIRIAVCMLSRFWYHNEYVDNLTSIIKYLIKWGIDVILITLPPLAMKRSKKLQKKMYKDGNFCEIRKVDRTTQFAETIIDVGESLLPLIVVYLNNNSKECTQVLPWNNIRALRRYLVNIWNDL
jgi:hypothetical protein